MKLSVVIPCYNESDNISATIAEVLSRAAGLFELCEIIVVDDHSTDDTFERAGAAKGATVRCLRLSRRSGSHIAIRVGLGVATGDVVLCISADGQDNPAELPLMLKKWREGAQIVWALRRERSGEPFHQKLFAQMFYRLLRFFNRPEDPSIDLSRADFYLLDRRVVDAILSCGERVTSLFGLVAWIGFRQDSVVYDRRLRRRGSSKWNFRRRIALALDWIVAFSWLPLRFSGILGLVIATAGGLYAIFVVVLKFLGGTVEGWSSVMVTVLVLSGIQLLILGTIGEYVGRGLDEARKRPIAFVEKEREINEHS
jgi:dolichol-phosphate mannosyltransferase